MTPITRHRLHLHLQRLAWRYLPTCRELESIWQNWLGWAVVVGIVAGTVAGVAVVWWRHGP